MNHFSFNKKNAEIRTLKEPPRKKNKMNLDRMLYFILIFIGLFFLLRYAYKKLLFIEVDGQISFEKLDVSFTDDIYLSHIRASEGDTVLKGDTLFSFLNRRLQLERNDFSFYRSESLKSKAEENSLKQQIAMKKIELKGINQEITQMNQRIKEMQQLVLLDAQPRVKFIQQKELKQSLTNTKNALALKINLLMKMLKELEAQPLFHTFSPSANPYFQMADAYVAPINGIVGQINFNEQEICYETQQMMTIHQPDQIQIRAYFDQKTVKNLQKGDQVKIIFPDGKTSAGTINNFLVSTYALPAEFQKRYEPVVRSILANVIPVDAKEEELWRGFYKMNVKVSINKLKRWRKRI